MSDWLWILSCYNGAAGVALGAFGAHALKKKVKDPIQLQVWDTAVKYHLIHACVLLTATKQVQDRENRKLSAGLLMTGNLLFSGSLYALVLTGVKKLGIITPFGGMCYIFGWLALAHGR
mmetsp:Transcript_33843/g.73200  ORF Transcript_33843/g.73200 Transcript_33843/m.73200 type:complete len:119 (-) Transcript_33843:222-578(-)